MPTPSPIIAASSVAKSGMATTWETSAIAPNAVPSPSSAVTIGSPSRANDPNASRSTTIAAASPIAVAEPSEVVAVSSIACPPSSTCSLGAAAWPAVDITRSIAAFGRSGPARRR